MRFDDSLDTVLAADMSGSTAVEWTWRQLVDLIGRRRSRARADAIARLHAIRGRISRPARLASARGLERANPPAALVALFIDDELAVAGPVVRSARLTAEEWLRLLPTMRPATRGVLRLRGDLPDSVLAALAAFGPSDFVLHHEGGEAASVAPRDEDAAVQAAAPADSAPAEPHEAAEPVEFIPPEPDSFIAVAQAARAIPAVVEALRRDDAADASAPAPQPATSREDFEIPALVARIAAHQRTVGNLAPSVPAKAARPVDSFRFETDAAGLIRWVDGIERSPLIGLSLTAGRDGRPAHVDGVAAGALAHRGRFTDARLEVGGVSEAAGSWRISGAPVFDFASGRFTGYRGTARRPRIDESPQTGRAGSTGPNSDALRQLVHELRTPTNAISGFAEMIERQMLGPVPDAYREQAASIRGQTLGLLDAIDDLDTAARIESDRLDLRADRVALAPLVSRILNDIDSLAQLRGAVLTLDLDDISAVGDRGAIDRLLSRFLTALVASGGRGEEITGRMTLDGDAVLLSVARPSGFVAPRGTLFEADAEAEAAAEGGPLLGTGFGFRLARRLAAELGGSLVVETDTLTLRLPAAVERGAEQAAN